MHLEPTCTTYDLGAHALEVSATRTVLIAAHPGPDEPIRELVELSGEEGYRLYLALQAVYQQE